MKTVIAIDSFKGSLSSREAGDAVKEAILSHDPTAEVIISPIADGGEGTFRAITDARGGSIISLSVTGPIGDCVNASYGIVDGENGKTAIIEMAEAAGITSVAPELRNPLNTTTYGVGEMIKDAIINHGCCDFIIGIGGSATNDGGIGMLTALGFEFLDETEKPVSIFGRGLSDIVKISLKNALPQLKECRIRVACDVTNPLCGDRGCSRIFGPQKGADEEIIKKMDAWLESYASLTKDILPNSDKDASGAGAAGGLGFAFLSYLNATLSSGIELVIEATGLSELVIGADLVITGEGRLDGQSCMGKAPVGVAKCAKKQGIPVIAFSGAVTDDAHLVNEHGIDAFFPILRAPCTLDEAMDKKNAYNNLRSTAIQAIRLFKIQ